VVHHRWDVTSYARRGKLRRLHPAALHPGRGRLIPGDLVPRLPDSRSRYEGSLLRIAPRRGSSSPGLETSSGPRALPFASSVRAHDGRSFWGIPRPDCEACADRDEGRAGEPPSPRPRIR
jgi:hypothetical protein